MPPNKRDDEDLGVGLDGMGRIGSKAFWNVLLEKAFLALIAWFLMSLIQDVRALNSSIQALNEKMAVVVTEVSNQKEDIKSLKESTDWLQKNVILKK